MKNVYKGLFVAAAFVLSITVFPAPAKAWTECEMAELVCQFTGGNYQVFECQTNGFYRFKCYDGDHNMCIELGGWEYGGCFGPLVSTGSGYEGWCRPNLMMQ